MIKLFGAKAFGALLFLVALPLGTQAALADSSIASFSLPSGEYKVPLPNGYCVPTGKYDASAKMVAAADNTNLTDITFYRCSDMASGANPESWVVIKTPLSTINSTVPPRSELIAEMKSQIDAAALKKIDDDAAQQAIPQARRVFGEDLKIGMDAKAVDSDNFGTYFAGTLTVSEGGDNSSTLAIAYAITVAEGNVFAIYVYGPYQGANDILDVLSKARKTTADFVSANGG